MHQSKYSSIELYQALNLVSTCNSTLISLRYFIISSPVIFLISFKLLFKDFSIFIIIFIMESQKTGEKNTESSKPLTDNDTPTQKAYVTSKKKWTEFELHPELIQALKINKMTKPTRVQEQTLPITTNPDRKKFNLLIRSINGSGKTLCYLLPILNSLKQGVVTSKDKTVGPKVFKNQIFMPQAIIFVQTGLLAQQVKLILEQFQSIAKSMAESEGKKLQLLNFTIGTMNNDGHKPGDIVISVIKSFLNRYERKNISFENCNFFALDEVDQIYESGENELQKVLNIIQEAPKAKLIVCSATMKKEFLQFYHKIIPKEAQSSLQININEMLRKQMGHNISLQGVSNYVHVSKTDQPSERHIFILNQIFKELYQNMEKKKPKVFMFFNSILEIQSFKSRFDQEATDLTNSSHKYLENLKVGIVAAKRKINGIEKELTHEERSNILTQFRNGDFNILLATNIIARGIDIRDVCFVINCDAPRDKQQGQISIDTYLHRVGRTGRHSDKGVALTIVPSQNDKKKLVSSVAAVHKVQIKELGEIKDLHKQIQDCIIFNASGSTSTEKQ